MNLLSFVTVEKAWGNSSLILNISEKGIPLPQDSAPIWMSLLVFALLVLAIFFFDRLKTACEVSFSLLFKKNMIKEIFDNTYGMISLNFSALMVVPVLAYILKSTNAIPHTFIYILIAIAILLLFKYIVIKLIEWVTSTDKSLTTLISFFIAFLFLTTLAAIPFLILRKFVTISDLAVILYISSISFILYVFMLSRSRQIILSSGFSHFFCFLYLCALEIIPIALAIRVIIL